MQETTTVVKVIRMGMITTTMETGQMTTETGRQTGSAAWWVVRVPRTTSWYSKAPRHRCRTASRPTPLKSRTCACRGVAAFPASTSAAAGSAQPGWLTPGFSGGSDTTIASSTTARPSTREKRFLSSMPTPSSTHFSFRPSPAN